MFGLFVLSLTIGLADSLNPTTVAPALFLATTSRARSALISFTAAVFGIYFLGGLLITLGPGELILSIAPHPRRDVKHIIEIAVGVVAAVAAVAAWLGRHRLQAQLKLEHFGEWFQRNSASIVAVLLAIASVGFLIAGTVGLLRTPHHRRVRTASAEAVRYTSAALPRRRLRAPS